MDYQLTHRLAKDFASLDQPKGRRKLNLFVAEGDKCVGELLPAFECRMLFALPEWIEKHRTILQAYPAIEIVEANRGLLGQITRLTSTPPVIAFFKLPSDAEIPSPEYVKNNLTVALDCVQDPGNLGTIMRCCDWMGVRTIIASPDTADAFSPKCIQASMGATARVKVVYTPLSAYLSSLDRDIPVYGTFLDGENIYCRKLSNSGILLMGNEGRGISDAVAAHVTDRLLIPSYPPGENTVESLNVAMATAIALSCFRSTLF